MRWVRRCLWLGLLVAVAPAAARADEPARVHAEVDPLPFARGGYGAQLGLRLRGSGLRFAVASFALDVPDAATQLSGNDGFHARVRPSGAVYVLYYPSPTRGGWAFGGSLRYLRLRYRHDDEPGARANVTELSPELIAGYKWHPRPAGFYLQPWFGLGVTAARDGDLDVGARTYDPPPVQLFATVNLGWDVAL
ncbi:MAG TPA: hypothetical protein VMZ28_17035 [Kofleriaceae bacterium]|nr:hypothetical protein [Kofleriaceae bacterium]